MIRHYSMVQQLEHLMELHGADDAAGIPGLTLPNGRGELESGQGGKLALYPFVTGVHCLGIV